MLAATNRCDSCGERTSNPENAYGEFMCDDCEQNAAEAAWERQQEGEPPITEAERYQAAWHEHQKAHRR